MASSRDGGERLEHGQRRRDLGEIGELCPVRFQERKIQEDAAHRVGGNTGEEGLGDAYSRRNQASGLQAAVNSGEIGLG